MDKEMTYQEFINLEVGKYKLKYEKFVEYLRRGMAEGLIKVIDSDDDVFVVENTKTKLAIDATPYTMEQIKENDGYVIFEVYDSSLSEIGLLYRHELK